MAIGTAGAVLIQARRSFPAVSGTLEIPGLEWPVEVSRDRWGVPHIQAESVHDLFLAQGYVTAQDRFWQMDLNRRAATGRLSELVGVRAEGTDRFLRRLGLHRVAEVEELELHAEERLVLQAYADGVNAYLEQHRNRLPPEYLLLRLTTRSVPITPWQPTDCLAFAKYLGWTLSPNWDNELARARLIADLGWEAARQADPTASSWQSALPPDDLDFRQVDWSLGLPVGEDLPGTATSGQSNNWAVSGSRTASGTPLLANDAHLRPNQPVTWYEMHLRGAGFDVMGMSVPGLPGVLTGHNGRIAWGVTAASVDVQDLVVEQFDPGDPEHYRTDSGWATVERRTETIAIAGRTTPITEEVRSTRHGPVLSAASNSHREYQVAFRSALYTPAHLMDALLALMRAADWSEFRAALVGWAGPSLNFVYADTAGHIGFQLAGWLPRRGPAATVGVPVPGWHADQAWDGFLPFDDLPRAYDPAEGYCATANNDLAAAGLPYRLPGEWTDAYRIKRIRHIIESRPSLTRTICREMQTDIDSGAARELIALLDDFPVTSGDETGALAILRRWDSLVAERSAAAALYEILRAHLIRRVLLAGVPGHLEQFFLGRGFHPAINPVNTLHVRFGSLLAARLAAARSGGWPAEMSEAVRLALRESFAEARARLGDSSGAWEWGRLHAVTFRHPLGDRALLDRLFNVGPSPIGGDAETLVQTNLDLWEGYPAAGWVPTYRFIIDLGNFDRSLAALPTGQSGHPLSPHYRDQHAGFLAGRYHPMVYSAEAVKRAEANRLVLVPR